MLALRPAGGQFQGRAVGLLGGCVLPVGGLASGHSQPGLHSVWGWRGGVGSRPGRPLIYFWLRCLPLGALRHLKELT